MMSTKETPQLEFQKVKGWKIWYADGSTFNSTQGSWHDAPGDGVQVVMLYFEDTDALGRPTRLYSSGCDSYAFDEATGQFESAFNHKEGMPGEVKTGTFMDYKLLLEMENEAFQDYGAGWLKPNEAKPDIGTKG